MANEENRRSKGRRQRRAAYMGGKTSQSGLQGRDIQRHTVANPERRQAIGRGGVDMAEV